MVTVNVVYFAFDLKKNKTSSSQTRQCGKGKAEQITNSEGPD